MLKQNGTLLAQMPLRQIGGAFAGDRTMFGRTERMNQSGGVGITSRLAGVPSGHLAPSAWILPYVAGAMASRNSAIGGAAATGSGALGVNGESAISAASSLGGIGDLIVSATATIAGQASVSGSVLAALQLSASLAAAGYASGALNALAWAIGSSTGTASSSGTASAAGALASDIEIGAQVGLSAPLIAEEILDTQMVETGLTVRETLRICLAALAGKISGAPGSTLTIRSADDSADRIVAIVDADGNRTDITLNAG